MHPRDFLKIFVKYFSIVQKACFSLCPINIHQQRHRDNSKIPFLGEDPSVEGRKQRVITCAWKKLFFCQVGWDMSPGLKVLSVYTEKHTVHGKME